MKYSGKHYEPKVVVRLYDFTIWLLQRTNRFPKNWRVTLGDRIDNLVVNMLVQANRASYRTKKSEILMCLSDNLDELKLLVRICHDLGCLKANQYKYASKEMGDIGKQLGGWIKQQAK